MTLQLIDEYFSLVDLVMYFVVVLSTLLFIDNAIDDVVQGKAAPAAFESLALLLVVVFATSLLPHAGLALFLTAAVSLPLKLWNYRSLFLKGND